MSKILAEERMLTARAALLGAWPPPIGPEAGGLPLRKLAAAAFRARFLVVGITVLGALIGAYLAFITPNTYVSQAKFLVTTSGSEIITVDPTRSSETKAETIAAVATFVLKADTLLRRVAQRVSPEEILAAYEPEQAGDSFLSSLFHYLQRDWNAANTSGSSMEDALRVLRRNLVVDHARYADVLVATYIATDRRRAQAVLAIYMEEAKKWHQEQYDDPKMYEEVKQRADDALVARNLAHKNLRDFLDREAQMQNTFDFELQHVRLLEAEAASELGKNVSLVVGTKAQIAELDKRLATLPATIAVKRRLDSSKAFAVVQEKIAQLEVQRAQAQVASAQERPPEVDVINRTIEKLQRNLQEMQVRQSTMPEITVDETNPEYTAARDSLARLHSELLQAETIAGQRRKDHDEFAGRLRRLLELEPRYVVLRDAVTRAENGVLASSETFAGAERKRLLQLGNFSTLQTIDDASLPLEKEGPNRGKMVLGGLLVGVFLALGIIVLRTLPDAVVRTPSDLEALQGIAVIGVMPRLDGKNLRRHAGARERGW